ncbi:unnamed protein product [Protopolystoma xenopodis]|uniref:BTB domain-containing protein n=1 Tax=Protopolystoma xenopodis TaxID=117903 RepID=A0A3S5BSJ5_9PLAT|nr:unnamed protein product [Protopolystoma xenopodis]
MNTSSNIVELNVGGTHYTTTQETIRSRPNSRLGQLMQEGFYPLRDGNNRLFIDRDGQLFRYILDFLRTGQVSLPLGFRELDRLRREASYFQLPEMLTTLEKMTPMLPQSPQFLSPSMAIASTNNASTGPANMTVDEPCCITIGYRGTFGFGRDGASADLRFRKLTRILVAGRISACHRVFGETLNDSRDPDVGNAYSSRFFLKHNNLEQAFDDLYRAGFVMVGCCGTGTSGMSQDSKIVQDPEETRWQHYNEFIFIKQWL